MESRAAVTTRAAVSAALCAAVAGCQTAPRTLYHWGSYEGLLYQGYSAPGKASPEQQIETLKADLEKAGAAHQPTPPGLHAQLGYLYAQTGKADAAWAEFETEKRLFPESATFIDGLLKRMKGGKK